MKFEIELPLPPKELSPNARVHYYKKAKIVKECRNLAYRLTIEMLKIYMIEPPKSKSSEIRRIFYFRTNTRRDADNWNIMTKHYIDGVVDAGLLYDDSTREVTYLASEFNIDKKYPRLILIVEIKE